MGRGLLGLPVAAGAGRGGGCSRPIPGPHSLVALPEAALRDGPHGRPRGLGVLRGAEAQAQLLLQAAGQGREAVAARGCPSFGLRARVTVLLVLDAPGRLLELVEILPVPVRRHRARCRRAPLPGRPATPCRCRTTPPGNAHSWPRPLAFCLGCASPKVSPRIIFWCLLELTTSSQGREGLN